MPVLAEEIAKAGVVAESLFATMRKQNQSAATKSLATSSPVKMRSISYAVSCATCSSCGTRSSSGGMSDGSSFIPADPSVRVSMDDARCIYVCMFSNTYLSKHVDVIQLACSCTSKKLAIEPHLRPNARSRALWTHAGFKFIHRWQKRRARRTEMANGKQN